MNHPWKGEWFAAWHVLSQSYNEGLHLPITVPLCTIPGFGNFAIYLNKKLIKFPTPQPLLAQGKLTGSDPRLFAKPVKTHLCMEIAAVNITVKAKRQFYAKLILGH